VAAYCWTDYVDADGRFVCPDSRPTHAGNVFERLLVHNFIDSGSSVMVRRQELLHAGCFDETLPVVEDWDLYLRLASRGPFVCVPRTYVRYRLSSTSLSTNVLAMERCFRRVIDRAFAAAPPDLQSLKRRSIALCYEYLIRKATQGFPTRDKARTALRFCAAAVSERPSDVWRILTTPWLLKGVAKAVLGYALPASRARRNRLDELS
jgi:GT2 family glycosyltransferase